MLPDLHLQTGPGLLFDSHRAPQHELLSTPNEFDDPESVVVPLVAFKNKAVRIRLQCPYLESRLGSTTRLDIFFSQTLELSVKEAFH